MSIIDYETYKRKFGTRYKGTKERHVAISQDIYDMLSRNDRLGIAFQSEISLALIEDVIINIAQGMMDGDKKGDLGSYKKLGQAIVGVLKQYKNKGTELSDRYYEIASSPEDRTFFADNPITEKNITVKTVSAITELGMFYRAMNTEVGEAVIKAIVEEKKKAVDKLYEAKSKNGTSSYYSILNFIISIWSRRISMYESYSKSMKLINGGIRNAGRK